MAHTSYESLSQKLEGARKEVSVGSLYRHYKNPDKHYTVLHLALQEDTEEVCVVYRTSHPSGLVWVRNLSDWSALVENDEGKSVRRFSPKEPL